MYSFTYKMINSLGNYLTNRMKILLTYSHRNIWIYDKRNVVYGQPAAAWRWFDNINLYTLYSIILVTDTFFLSFDTVLLHVHNHARARFICDAIKSAVRELWAVLPL